MRHYQWENYVKHLFECDQPFLRLDISRMNFPEGYLEKMRAPLGEALRQMAALEGGAIANPDEGRQVGHYWLRDSRLAPSEKIAGEIEALHERVRDFARAIRQGEITGPQGTRFRSFLIIGIGGSALGSQLLADALTESKDGEVYFCDNTDPEGMDRIFSRLSGKLAETLTIVVSKSGKTVETRNGMQEAREAYRQAGAPFGPCAVAVTEEESDLCRLARQEGWLACFPLWDWVGGRTSITSVVGLLPAALLGIDTLAFLEGAKKMDALTRQENLADNPAALLACMWHWATDGRGARDMVFLPYKDRLALLPRYLQQLVMESLGKRHDRTGLVVNQGISVFGNKGATDQHSYVQQLRDGPDNFFVTFIAVLKDREGFSLEVEPGVTSGDYLAGFLLGTREALSERERQSLTITLAVLDAASLGMLVALYERAVGLFAELVNVNAYHQPGVEAGKKAAREAIILQGKLLAFLRSHREGKYTAQELAKALGEPQRAELVFHILEHAAANVDHGIVRIVGRPTVNSRFGVKGGL